MMSRTHRIRQFIKHEVMNVITWRGKNNDEISIK